MKRFENKVVLVTGGARGMGKTHVEGFLEEGASVVFTDILEDEGKKTEKELGTNCFFVKQDVSKPEDWQNLAKFIDQKFGKLDVLVNNAGVVLYKMLGDMTPQDYKWVTGINQDSIFYSMTYLLDLLKKGTTPSVVNISSITGFKGSMAGSAYASSKHAVLGLSKCAAQEGALYGIRVNTILPGVIETPMIGGEDVKAAVQQFAQQVPLKRVGKPEEVTKAVLFFASQDSAFCTGAELVIDGGSTLL